MEMSGIYRIPAPREKVWEMLNDPAVLKECIPGCQSLEPTDEGGFAATVKAKVGPVSATFKGVVTLENVNPPESYTIAGEGKGGVAGFGKGSADVALAADGGETDLTYNAKAQVGGKLAQLGSRLIDSTAKKMADDFFGKFADLAGEVAVDDPAIKTDAPVGDALTHEATAPIAATEAPAPQSETPESTPQPQTAVSSVQASPEPKTNEEAPGKLIMGQPLWVWIAAGAALLVVLMLLS